MGFWAESMANRVHPAPGVQYGQPPGQQPPPPPQQQQYAQHNQAPGQYQQQQQPYQQQQPAQPSDTSSRTFEVTLSDQRLGMTLQNVCGSTSQSRLRAEVRSITKLGAAELSGQIQLGDIVTMVNNLSTAGLDFYEVLDLLVGTERPITIHFERRSAT